MSRDSQRTSERLSRRKFLVASGAAGAAGIAGCLGGGGSSTDTPEPENNAGDGDTPADGDTPEPTATPGSGSVTELKAEGSSTVYPISNKGASYWSSNAPPDDGEYWGSNENNTVPGWEALGSPDMRLADYFASLYGFEPTGKISTPPYSISVGLSHSGTGCEAVNQGLVDIGNSSGPITAELDWSEQKAEETVVDHVVGRDGQPIVVSKDIWDAGVQQLTAEQVRGIYSDEINNWSEVGGPDKPIFCIGRASDSGTATSFRLNMMGGADVQTNVDTRKGQNQGVAQTVQQNEGAIAYMALAFTGPQVKPIALEFDGTVYKPNKDAENTIFDSAYPLNRDLHMYTKITDETPDGTDMREAAFINMFLTQFGQKVFVENNNYIPLPTKDIESEKAKLPEQA